MKSYFSLKEYLYDNFDKQYRTFGFNCNNIEEHIKWKDKVKKELYKISGIDKMQGCEFNAEVVESVNIDGITREKIIINTQNNIKMPFYVLKPDKGCKKAVLAIHGHGSDGKNTLVGIINDSMKDKFDKYNYTYAMDLAKMGFVVYVPDLCGSGERREKKQQGDDKLDKSSCDDLNFALMSLGLSLQGVITYDLMRLLDYIKEDNRCNSDKICCVGFSGGGSSALWLSALDERIDLAVVSGYYHGFRDSILENNFCGCNFIPNLWKTVDCGDFGAMIAPRGLIIEVGDKDNLNGSRGIHNVYPQVDIAKAAYKLYNKEEKINCFICDGAHKWFGAGYDLIKKWGEA